MYIFGYLIILLGLAKIFLVNYKKSNFLYNKDLVKYTITIDGIIEIIIGFVISILIDFYI